MYINDADMFVAPYYIYILTHYRMMTLSFKFHNVKIDYFRPIDAIKLTIEVLITPHTNREAVSVVEFCCVAT